MVMRISGMSSGLDIDKIVSDLMKAERIPQDRLKQKRDLYAFEMDLYREVNTKVAAFRDALNAMRFSSAMTGMKATSSTTDVTAVVKNTMPATTFTVSVSSVATNAQMSSSSKVSNEGLIGTSINTPITFDNTNNSLLIRLDTSSKIITLTPGTYNSPTDLQVELQKQLDKAFGTGAIKANLVGSQFSLEPNAALNGFKPQIIVTELSGAAGKLGFSNNQSYRLNLHESLANNASKFASGGFIASGQFEVNDVVIDYSTTDSIQDIINRVNSSGAGVTMSYDELNDRFIFRNNATGSTSVSFKKLTDDNFLDAINITDASVAVGTIVSSAAGKDAEFTITKQDGTVINVTQSSNQYTPTDSDLSGLTLTINRITDSPVTISAEADADNIVSKVKAFVTAYNDLIDLVNKRLSEKPTRGYSPLTEEQKAGMEKSEIELWNNKVKTGLLHNSEILKDIKSATRELFTKTVTGVSPEFNTLFKIGITTVPYVRGVTQDAGKLQIDEEKLRNAIAKDPASVSQLFTNNPGVESQEGIAVTLYNRANDFLTSLTKKAGRVGGSTTDVTTDLGKKTTEILKKIDEWNEKLNKKEDVYYRRFIAMENAIAKNNSVLNWLSQQMGG